MVTAIRPVETSPGAVHTTANFVVVETLVDELPTIGSAGSYADRIVPTDAGLRFAAKAAIYDRAARADLADRAALSAVPAITPLDFDELPPPLRDALRSRYERLGYLGDFFRHMAHQPAALLAFEQFTHECKQALPVLVAEAVALTVSTRLGNDYERTQHERLAVRSGATRAWVESVERLAPDATPAATTLDQAVRAAQRFALAAIDGLATGEGNGSAPPASAVRLDELVELTDDATAAAIALLTARFVAHALVSRACRLRPPVPSIFEDGCDG